VTKKILVKTHVATFWGPPASLFISKYTLFQQKVSILTPGVEATTD